MQAIAAGKRKNNFFIGVSLDMSTILQGRPHASSQHKMNSVIFVCLYVCILLVPWEFHIMYQIPLISCFSMSALHPWNLATKRKQKIKIKTKDYQTKKQIAMVAALSHSESQGIPFSLSSFICISMLQCVIGLVWGLWHLLHYQYWILTRPLLGSPFIVLCHELQLWNYCFTWYSSSYIE